MKRCNRERDFIFSRNAHRSTINNFAQGLIYHVDIIKSMLSSFYSSCSQYHDGVGGLLPEESGMGVRPTQLRPGQKLIILFQTCLIISILVQMHCERLFSLVVDYKK